MEFINLKAQYERIKHVVHERIDRVLASGQYIAGPEINELEERLAAFVKVKHVQALSSGTDALLLALMALEVGSGDEVITTPFSFFSTVEVISLLGAKPVFVDIDPKTYNIDATLIESAITARTKAIMPVNLFGQCADFDSINALARQHGLGVVEDAAQSFGASYKQRSSGSLATIACTSFYPSKPLGGYGDGGACFTDDDELAHKLQLLHAHGEAQRYEHVLMGINARMSSIQAAVLLAKLDIFAEETANRVAIGGRYTELLANMVQTPYVEPHNVSVYAQYTIEVDERDRVQAFLHRHNIPTAVHYPKTITEQAAYLAKGLPSTECPRAEAATARVLSLPMHPYLTAQEQERVVAALGQCALTNAA